MEARLELTRPQILAFRRRVAGLDERLPSGRQSLRRAAWAGLQDSMPRAALLSIHARDEETMRAPAGADAPARLLPSGDTYFLLQGDDRDLLVPEPERQSERWTSGVWPGALLVQGEVVGPGGGRRAR